MIPVVINYYQTARALLFRLVRPRSVEEDVYRRELVLNIILLCSVILSGFGLMVHVVDRLVQYHRLAFHPLAVLVSVFALFLFLYILSRIRFHTFAASALLAIYMSAALYTAFVSGTDNPQVLLLYALIIVTSGVLISTSVSVWLTALIVILTVEIGHLQLSGQLLPMRYFRHEMPDIVVMITYAVTLLIILFTSWLSNHETERNLLRAHRAEARLKHERDLLEVRVARRTRQLQHAQMEKLIDLYHFAEFGKLASGLFHDLINPLTSVSLNLEQMDSKEHSQMLNRALEGTRYMERFVEAARRQIQHREISTYFRVDEEIRAAITLLSAKARQESVEIIFRHSQAARLYGNPIKFHKSISNVIANGIDAYASTTQRQTRSIQIDQVRDRKNITITFADHGSGIDRKNIPHIFEPFFSTKPAAKGMGIGLSITKEIIEKDFGGTITVGSTVPKGTTFTITLPRRHHAPNSH